MNKEWKQQIIGTLIAYGLILIPLVTILSLPETNNKLFGTLQIMIIVLTMAGGMFVLFSTPAFKEKYGKKVKKPTNR